jgi:hypothetical protein
MLINPEGITNFSMEKRVLEPLTQFSFTYNARAIPADLVNGTKIMYYLQDLFGASNPIMFRGRLEKNSQKSDPKSISYSITGRDNGLYLSEQPIMFPCYKVSTAKLRIRDFKQLFKRIIRGTGLSYGPEVNQFRQLFTNNPKDENWYCGEYSTKKDAIDMLLMRYGQLQGIPDNWYRWYVDSYGAIRIFNAYAENKTTGQIYTPSRPIMQFSMEHLHAATITFESIAEAIKNDITIIGGPKNEYRCRLTNKESIKQHGRRVNPVIQDSTLITQTDVDNKAKETLARLSQEIYIGTVEMAGFPYAEPGIALKFLNSGQYADKTFIMTSVKHDGTPGSYRTTIGFSTDEFVIVNPNLSDMVEQIIKARTSTSAPALGDVVSVDEVNGTIEVTPQGSLSTNLTNKQNIAIATGGTLTARVMGTINTKQGDTVLLFETGDGELVALGNCCTGAAEDTDTGTDNWGSHITMCGLDCINLEFNLAYPTSSVECYKVMDAQTIQPNTKVTSPYFFINGPALRATGVTIGLIGNCREWKNGDNSPQSLDLKTGLKLIFHSNVYGEDYNLDDCPNCGITEEIMEGNLTVLDDRRVSAPCYLYGETDPQGFIVQFEASNDTDTALKNGEIKITLGGEGAFG